MTTLTDSKFLTDDELAHLLALCNRHQGERDSILIRLCLFSGARGAEVIQVRKRDIGKGCVTVTGAKGSNNRTVPLPPAFFVELEAYSASLKPDDRLFPIAARTWRHIFGQWRPNPKKGGHALRHTFGVRLYSQSRDIHLLKTALGHVSIRNSEIYLSFVEGREKLAKATAGMWEAKVDHAS